LIAERLLTRSSVTLSSIWSGGEGRGEEVPWKAIDRWGWRPEATAHIWGRQG
jgi:hypothetical protein